MQITIWSVIRWVHIMSAITWIGGMLFIVLVLLPILIKALPKEDRTILFAKIAERYGVVSWIALTLLVITGVLNGEHRHIAWTHLADSSYGRTLGLKLIFVAIVIVITLVHALYYGRRITRLAEQAKALGGAVDPKLVRERAKLQRLSIGLSSLNLLLNLIIVLLAASLVA